MKILMKDCQYKERTIYYRSFSLNDKGNHEMLSHSYLIYRRNYNESEEFKNEWKRFTF